jgi:hypothetical protein
MMRFLALQDMIENPNREIKAAAQRPTIDGFQQDLSQPMRRVPDTTEHDHDGVGFWRSPQVLTGCAALDRFSPLMPLPIPDKRWPDDAELFGDGGLSSAPTD